MPNIFPDGYFDEDVDNPFGGISSAPVEDPPREEPPLTEEQMNSYRRWKGSLWYNKLIELGMSPKKARQVVREKLS